MTVTVRLFAVVREKAGIGECRLELREPAVVADLRGPLLQRFPALRDHVDRCAYAVNRNYAKQDAALTDGDEVALIPPVSGG